MSMETLTGFLKELGRRGDFYEYEVGGTKVATKKPDVAASVNSLIGQDVEMNAMKSQKTKDGVLYTNYYVVSAVPAQGAPPPQVGAGAPSSSQPAPTSSVVNAPASIRSDKDTSIERQNAMRQVAALAPVAMELLRQKSTTVNVDDEFTATLDWLLSLATLRAENLVDYYQSAK